MRTFIICLLPVLGTVEHTHIISSKTLWSRYYFYFTDKETEGIQKLRNLHQFLVKCGSLSSNSVLSDFPTFPGSHSVFVGLSSIVSSLSKSLISLLLWFLFIAFAQSVFFLSNSCLCVFSHYSAFSLIIFTDLFLPTSNTQVIVTFPRTVYVGLASWLPSMLKPLNYVKSMLWRCTKKMTNWMVRMSLCSMFLQYLTFWQRGLHLLPGNSNIQSVCLGNAGTHLLLSVVWFAVD